MSIAEKLALAASVYFLLIALVLAWNFRISQINKTYDDEQAGERFARERLGTDPTRKGIGF